ncbi:MAG: winged helix-turn-helix transcriptional regulator [Planctomycetaceae bacterium]|nr:winged helix-turn-helix transcriptional regulator [Planctomycetaceae bacterium]
MIIRNSISAVGSRIMRLLIGQCPKTMSELIEATGVTRTAVSEQLNELISAGYIQQKLERLPGRGRPRYLYSATDFALKKLFEGYQSVLVPAAWRAIKKHCGEEVMTKVVDEISSELAEHFNRQIESNIPEERLQEYTDIICRSGRLGACRVEGEHSEFDKLSCPFVSMYDGSGIVCDIDELAMSKIVKAPVARIRCRLEGDPCCTFRFTKKPGDLIDIDAEHDTIPTEHSPAKRIGIDSI